MNDDGEVKEEGTTVVKIPPLRIPLTFHRRGSG